ncbi:hypothetical protein H0H92_001421 [Tricholoma furcatifolium]|nr:hypothetical protein H0H92_001421 [Tricholoma furcatifolium]
MNLEGVTLRTTQTPPDPPQFSPNTTDTSSSSLLPPRTRFRIDSVTREDLGYSRIVIKANSPGLTKDAKDAARFYEDMKQAVLFTAMEQRELLSIAIKWDIYPRARVPDNAELLQGFLELGSILSVLGTMTGSPFGRWGELEISLPNREILFEPDEHPRLPAIASHLTSLHSLSWTGHSRQLLDSWLPLTPALLQTLKKLQIRSCIVPEYLSYILRNSTGARELTIGYVTSPAFSTSVIPPGPPKTESDVIRLSFLNTLKITAFVDICPVLEPVRFPSLTQVCFILRCTAYTTSLQDLNINWSRGSVRLIGFFSDAEIEWMNVKRGPELFLDIRPPADTTITYAE